MTFDQVRQLGVSLFASAGVAGLAIGLAARPLLTSLIAGVQIGTSKPNEMHARMNMPTGAATRRDIYQRMLEKIRPYFTKERFARALLGIFCALMASPLSAQLVGALDATQTFLGECCFSGRPGDGHQLASLDD
jgi:Mechanosensitive ion channel